jgi:hypothetical protein
VETEPKGPGPGRETLICDADLVQAGFYPAEVSEDGIPFRWIGPHPTATVFLPPLGRRVEVTLRVHSAFLPEVLEEVRLSLDGGPWVPALLWQGDDGRTSLSARLSAGPMAHLGTLRLDIDSIRTESPRQRGGTDDRPLSLALSAISLRALGD